MLLEDVQPRGPVGLVGDLLTVQAVNQHLEDLIRELIPKLATSALDAAALAYFRHDLRTPLHQIIGYCDLWLEDEDEAAAVAPFRSDLGRLRTAGRALLERIEGLRDLDPSRLLADGVEPSSDAAVAALVQSWAATAPAAAPRRAGPPGRILIVDDNPFNREVLVRRHERQGHAVAEAADGRQALALLAERPFDVMLLDILMPQVNGLEVLQRVKADPRLRDLPVVMISALNDIDNVAHCLQMGADDYLPRPYNATILNARVDALLEQKRLRDREVEHLRQIEREKERVDELLHVILPAEAVRELREHGEVRPRRFENVAVLFSDVVGFTPYCDAHSAEEVVAHLRRLVERFEGEAEHCGVQKIKTIGDAFMAAAGLLRPSANPVLDCVRCGVAIARAAGTLPPYWQVRVGVHVGPVMAGVVGSRQYLFDLWGDTVNTAARVQSHGEPGTVTLTREAWACVASCCRGTSRGAVELKGKGMMELVRVEEVH
jgi:class 3 adenylate cyclase